MIILIRLKMMMSYSNILPQHLKIKLQQEN